MSWDVSNVEVTVLTVPWKRPASVPVDPPGKVTVPTFRAPGGVKIEPAQVTTIVSATAAVEIANTAPAIRLLIPLMPPPVNIESFR